MAKLFLPKVKNLKRRTINQKSQPLTSQPLIQMGEARTLRRAEIVQVEMAQVEQLRRLVAETREALRVALVELVAVPVGPGVTLQLILREAERLPSGVYAELMIRFLDQRKAVIPHGQKNVNEGKYE